MKAVGGERSLRMSCCCSEEHVALALGVLDAAASYGEVFRVSLNPDEVPAHINRRNASATGPHEGV